MSRNFIFFQSEKMMVIMRNTTDLILRYCSRRNRTIRLIDGINLSIIPIIKCLEVKPNRVIFFTTCRRQLSCPSTKLASIREVPEYSQLDMDQTLAYRQLIWLHPPVSNGSSLWASFSQNPNQAYEEHLGHNVWKLKDILDMRILIIILYDFPKC